ncbi:tRNA glutamyl-Q(34) synthetase GluQRS [Aurantiacibacter xanthus]|uniref:tRNA glutamyl-Q(34) synthetase GluQRS n=1 Tax=Aurantiacibacter xanthus TaxID=1784712 RepID=A0A3A1PAR7_9SPHN|nr:tRNA glutamyl-Q(34) synthetase GluQRS [Aurantiacibacter xanthus]RIV90871.1 tRNA glutamyl-Q(34) synthetase GluQRS [Aurantiacibacter xanthus]
MIVTRFAPSPNGPLHLGHAFSALTAHDLAARHGGRFLLRIEDIDGARSRPELADEFRRDLEWLGLEWDEVPAQSTRVANYDLMAHEVLYRALGVLYPCRCTRAEIAAAARETAPDGSAVYPGTCREHPVSGDTSHCAWRLDMARACAIAGPHVWTDELAGEQKARPELFGDVVILRKDAPASYHLAATMDDHADGVTLVTRGMDLFASTHVHRLLQALLGLSVPTWHHHALLLDGEGRKLAKRRESPALAELRLAGADGRALADRLRAHQLPAGISLSEGLHGCL